MVRSLSVSKGRAAQVVLRGDVVLVYERVLTYSMWVLLVRTTACPIGSKRKERQAAFLFLRKVKDEGQVVRKKKKVR